jgi:WD40 repeat protein
MKKCKSFELGELIMGLALNSTGQKLVVVGNGSSAIFDTKSGEKLCNISELCNNKDESYAFEAIFHPTQKDILCISTYGSNLHIIDINTGRSKKHKFKTKVGARPQRLSRLAFSQDGKYLAMLCDYGVSNNINILLFDELKPFIQLEVEEDTEEREGEEIVGMTFIDSDNFSFVTDRGFHFYEIKSNKRNFISMDSKTDGRADMVYSVKNNILYGPIGKKILSLNLNDKVETYLGQTDISRLRLSNNNQYLFAASWRGKKQGVWRWDLKSKRSKLLGHKDSGVFALAYDEKQDIVYAGGYDKKVMAWNGSTLEQII